MKSVKPATLLALLLAVAATTAGCIVSAFPGGPVGVYGNGKTVATSANPVINEFDYSPKEVDQNSAITFTVVAHSPSGNPLQYNWASTKGTMSSTTGQAVSWRPLKSDGSLDVGIATITVIVTDGANATTGTLNINVGNGTASVAGPATGVAASATPGPAATATPSAPATTAATPAATPTAAATTAATPTATPTAAVTQPATAAATPAASAAATPAATAAATT